jgi:hypothetical protein
MIEITGNQTLVAWLAISLWGGGFWLLERMARNDPSRMITVPHWVLLLCGIRHGNQIDHKKIGPQLTCIFLIVWATVLAIFVPSYDLWHILFGIGLLLAFVGFLVFEVLKDTLLGKRSRGN